MTQTCSCGGLLEVEAVPTSLGVVQLTICPACDRRKCRSCGFIDMTGTRQRCPCGAPMSITDR